MLKRLPVDGLIALALIPTVLVIERWLAIPSAFFALISDQGNALQQRELDMQTDALRSMNTLSVLVFGGMAAIVFNRYKDRVPPRDQARRLLLVTIFNVISMIAGHSATQLLMWLLGERIVDLSAIRSAVAVQFWTFLFGMVFLASFAYRALLDVPAPPLVERKYDPPKWSSRPEG
jgi:hypothetical protein